MTDVNPFDTKLSAVQASVFFDKYSRFDWGKGRREAWPETVERAVGFLREVSGNKLSEHDYAAITQGIETLGVMPSMRLLASAGESARRHGAAIYNCSYLPIRDLLAFQEIMLLSMNGCGVGYSVEHRNISQLPSVLPQSGRFHGVHTVGDSTDGWVEALGVALKTWFNGEDLELDYSQVRPAGSILRVKGGRASGPQPLKEAMEAIRAIILSRQGQYLRSIDVHDVACWIAHASISGGVRRSALISLFDYNDELMLRAKEGNFGETDAQRYFANNTAVITDEVTDAELERLVRVMNENGTGEPGFFNRSAARRHIPYRRADAVFGLNPCGEVLLREFEFCNLSSVVCRAEDTVETLVRKVQLATIIGTIQSMVDWFPGLRPEWHNNQVEERLLGVDLNGQMDCPVVQRPEVQELLRQVAVKTNAEYARKLGIRQSAAVTTVKPSGNSGQFLDAASGLHDRYAPFYIRRMRFNAHSPVFKILRDQGAPVSPENGQTEENAVTWVVPFPVKAPEGAVTRGQRTALQQLEYVAQVRSCWTEHQPSCTINYKPDEVEDIIAWMLANRERLGGLSFLPSFDASYAQMPYEEIDQATYERLVAEFPAKFHFEVLPYYEDSDYTTAAGEIACVGGACELP